MNALALLLAATLPGFGWAAAPVPAKPKAPKVLPGIVVEMTTRDGWRLKAKYVPAKDARRTFVLLHDKGRRMDDWYWLGRALVGWGYGFLAPDLRGHGQSTASPEGQKVTWRDFRATKTYNEFANMSQDVEAAVGWLLAQGVAESDIGVVGAELGSSIGVKFAAVHPKVPLVVMLSPGMRYQEVLTVNAMRAYKDRPILMVYAEDDKKAASETALLSRIAQATTGGANTTVLAVKRKERGTKMLTPALSRQIIEWLAEPVKPPTPSVGLVSFDTAPASSPALPGEEPYPRAADELTTPDDGGSEQ